MGKSILFLCSSPRREGNTNTVVGWAAAAARQAGARVETIDAAHLKYGVNGCISCLGCQQQEAYRCVIDDEATPLIAVVPDYEVLVLASPIYYLGLNAQIKLFLDRMFSLFKFDMDSGAVRGPLLAGKRTLALLATCGGGLEDSGIRLAEQTGREMARFSRSDFQSLLVPDCGFDVTPLQANTQVRAQAEAFGRQLTS